MATGATNSQPPQSIHSNNAPLEQKTTSTEHQPDEPLPKLSFADFKLYNKLAVMMEYYHNHFRTTWTLLHTSCTTNTRPTHLTLTQFLSTATQLIQHLTIHHQIEEAHIFPILAEKMPEFHSTSTMITQHGIIHDGLDRLEVYIKQIRRGERELKLNAPKGEGGMLEVLDSFGDVLWTHLDEEVKNLGAENMRRYWTREEMRGFNF